MEIRKAAILGAGTMGSAIAAHLANAGIPSYLLDIIPPDQEERNKLSLLGLERAKKMKPPLFFDIKDSHLISCGNYKDNLDWLKQVDWIIEAVIEDPNIKQNVFQMIDKVKSPDTIVSSNTSGIRIDNLLPLNISSNFKSHFLITHFFNPVRYMRLVEIIKPSFTLDRVKDTIVKFIDICLGKGIVEAKDTPGFIANRIGTYTMMVAFKSALERGLKVEEVDAILGEPIGRPKSGIFRTVDIVGVDLVTHMSKYLYTSLPKDEERDIFEPPQILLKMIKEKLLGQKTQGGFYKVIKHNGKKRILSLDFKSMEYKEQISPNYQSLVKSKEIADPKQRIQYILSQTDPLASLVWKTLSSTMVYALKRIPEIADTIIEIDNAMKWGYGWSHGPFELWDIIGIKEVIKRLEKQGEKIPEILTQMLSQGKEKFYQRDNKGKRQYFDFPTLDYKDVIIPKGIIFLSDARHREGGLIFDRAEASLIDLGQGILCLAMKRNTIRPRFMEIICEAMDIVQDRFKALMIATFSDHFSFGADLHMLVRYCEERRWDEIERACKLFQDTNMRLKYASFPVMILPWGFTLGGGAELTMSGRYVHAHSELYIGQPEVGVGLVPAGGGTKELLLRIKKVIPFKGPMPFIQKVFEIIGFGKVSGSIKEAMELGFIEKSETYSMNRERVIFDGRERLNNLIQAGYTPLSPCEIHLPGPSARLVLEQGIEGMFFKGRISEHDKKIGCHLARILTGGEVHITDTLSEDHILDLEREAFLSLCGEEKTQARMRHMLKYGKPLRN